MTAPGQIKKGMLIVLVLKTEELDYGKFQYEKVKEVLNPGTDREEVIYRKKKNWYFITSNVLNGHSRNKEIHFVRAEK